MAPSKTSFHVFMNHVTAVCKLCKVSDPPHVHIFSLQRYD